MYIFQEDGTLILSYNGKVCKTRWEYIAQNTSLIIEDAESDTYMLKPAYYDNKMLVLQVDGTNEYAIMVNENHIGELMLDSLDRIKQYIVGQQKMATQAKEASFALNKNYLEHFTKEKAESSRKSHEARAKLIKSKQKRKNINIGISITAVLSSSIRCLTMRFFQCMPSQSSRSSSSPCLSCSSSGSHIATASTTPS